MTLIRIRSCFVFQMPQGKLGPIGEKPFALTHLVFSPRKGLVEDSARLGQDLIQLGIGPAEDDAAPVLAIGGHVLGEVEQQRKTLSPTSRPTEEQLVDELGTQRLFLRPWLRLRHICLVRIEEDVGVEDLSLRLHPSPLR